MVLAYLSSSVKLQHIKSHEGLYAYNKHNSDAVPCYSALRLSRLSNPLMSNNKGQNMAIYRKYCYAS